MINITIYQTGEVTGDCGKLIGYEGTELSEVINIVHPIYEGCNYAIEYKLNQVVCRKYLDSNNHVSLTLGESGYITCQLLALDISTGNIVWQSYRWNFIIGEKMKVEPSHYPCYSHVYNSMNHHVCDYYGHHDTHDCINNDTSIDSYNAYYKLMQRIENEETVRFDEIQRLTEDVIKIKQVLNIGDVIPSTADVNTLTSPGEYIVTANSENLPSDDSQEFRIHVYKYNSTISQQAFELDNDNIWYRTGKIASDDSITWTNWVAI